MNILFHDKVQSDYWYESASEHEAIKYNTFICYFIYNIPYQQKQNGIKRDFFYLLKNQKQNGTRCKFFLFV